MSLDCEKYLDYEQHLSANLKRLYFEDTRYEPLRTLIKKQCKDKVDGLVFAVRKNEIHIYYRGGRLLKITETANGAALKIYTDPKYVGEGPDNEIDKLNAEDISNNASIWCDNLEKLKGYVVAYYVEHKNKERHLQHMLELNNRDFKDDIIVIDNEYGVRMRASRLTHLDRANEETFGEFTDKELEILSQRGLDKDKVLAMTDDELARLKLEYKLCKVDLVALFKGDDRKYKICLTELKKGNASTGGKAGIKDHIQDFKIFTGARKNDIVRSVERLIEYKTSSEIDTIANYHADDFELDRDNIYITILCYDLSSDRKRNNVKNDILQVFDSEARVALPNFYYNLHMFENNGYTLSKGDLLKNGI